ncbi:Flavoprotein [Brevibacterium sp. 239c]|uniref:CypD family RiPP peptide-cysteine decarboxylase n=1 Tax=Brevibacterium sp. 239c TaxID=1965356 RepID=UPI000C38FEF3|nr:CypD family RiPP peptide-cysteine decarboxylase [Brevibacterium sp. 239c]SMY04053.1 Flavoprotein [Brevibacterium sp. 239c]
MTTDVGEYGVYHGSEMHLHITGSIGASLVPWWIHWFRHINQDVVVNASISRGASRFVTKDAIAGLCNGHVWEDEWDDAKSEDWRQGRTGDSDCIIVFPASLDSVMRLAQGRSDSPALMMMQVTNLPIILCEAIPVINSVIEHWRDILLERPNVTTAPPVVGIKATDRDSQETGFNLPGAIAMANELIDASREGDGVD